MKTSLKFFAYFAMVLMVASILSTGALAASDNAQKSGILVKDRDRDMVNANESALREQAEGLNKTTLVNRAKENKNVKAGYFDARDNFVKLKATDRNLASAEAIEATKEYLNNTIDYMIDSLDSEEHITKLEQEKENVAAASTRKELAESAKDIRDIWKDARRDRVTSSVTSISNKFTATIKASEAIALRFGNEIARLEEEGEDVTELEEMLNEYNALIAEAKGHQEQARNAYTRGEEYSQIAQNMNQAGQSLREANAVLKDMLQQLKQHREGLVALSGNETLTAEGNGTAVLSGNLKMTFSATDAKLIVKDLAGDAIINTSDASYGSSNINAGNSESNNRALVFDNLTGTVTIEGSRLTVMLRAEDISLSVEGEGTAVLSGDGSYELNGVSKEWAKQDDEENESDESSEESGENEDDDDSGNEFGNNTSEGNSSVSDNLTVI
jgi:NADH dehydrogenase/NADH:ubiquinone oxidoreductase subunit G